MMTWWYFALAGVVAVLGTARLALVLTEDTFPLAVRVRIFWDRITHDGEWSTLVHCVWCCAPWMLLVAGGWFGLAYFVSIMWLLVIWWVFWSWLSLSLLASAIAARAKPYRPEE